MVKKLIVNLDLSKASGPDCIPVVVLQNCEPGLSYIAELFNKCLKKSCFPDYWKVSSPTRKLCIHFVYKNYTRCIYLMHTKCIQNVYMQNAYHILTNFCIHFVYKIKRTMPAKFFIQNV